MNDSLKLNDSGGVIVEKRLVPNDAIELKGRFNLEITRANGDIEIHDITNTITNTGKNSILGVQFHGDTQITAWYIGLMSNDSFGGTSVGDTMSSHAGWLEAGTGGHGTYTEATRQTWGAGAASSQSITNSSAAVFSITSSHVLKGIFVVSDSAKGGVAGVLWSTALFTSTLSVSNGDTVKITYTVNAG